MARYGGKQLSDSGDPTITVDFIIRNVVVQRFCFLTGHGRTPKIIVQYSSVIVVAVH